jgi:hypothetical protein
MLLVYPPLPTLNVSVVDTVGRQVKASAAAILRLGEPYQVNVFRLGVNVKT